MTAVYHKAVSRSRTGTDSLSFVGSDGSFPAHVGVPFRTRL